MALVVTARSAAVTGSQELGGAALRRPRAHVVGVRLALGAAVVYALALVATVAARVAPSAAWSDILGAVSALIALVAAANVAIGAWAVRRDDAGLLLAATFAAVLAVLRLVADGLLETVELPATRVVADAGLGLLALGAIVWTTSAWLVGPGAARRSRSARAELFLRVVDVTALVIFGLVLSGATVTAVGAAWACDGGFPDCSGFGVLPFGRDPLADIQLYHRMLAYVALALVVWLAAEAFRTQRAVSGIGKAGLVLLGSMLGEGAIGAISVSTSNPPLLQALHMAGAATTWSAAVVMTVLVRRAPLVGFTGASAPTREHTNARMLAAYVQLTKPRVMSLLLATTAAAMVIAARGMPDLGIFLATLIGGALMSGGAGAINHYVDRDIDPLMGRTAWRPIPSGVIAPRRALWFGIGLAVLSSAVFVAFVNLIAWVLALLGLLGYVFIYTLWLKRSTPSNIVIGGAAGAIPPLVGWAAVTNEIGSLTAWYLFAIIFFWTPPHFWALSLLIRKHYERAGVPMLPVVRGEDETRFQIVLYSILLIVLTLVLSPFGMMGTLYFASATVLGFVFLRGALRLWREATPQAARRLYLYSILYLFALFAAMAVDRVVG